MGVLQSFHGVSRRLNKLKQTHTFLHFPFKTLFEYIPIIPISVNFRSIHDNSVKSQVTNDPFTQTPDPKNPKFSLESETICRLLLNHHHNNSNIESALDSAAFNVSDVLVVEVLKKLSNAGVLALAFFRWAEKQSGYKPTADMYNSLIEALGRIRQFKMIWVLVSDMKKKNLFTKDTFLLILRRYVRARNIKEAVSTFEKMERFGLKPELCDYNKFLDLLCKSGNVERAQQMFDNWSKRKFSPDVKSYTILLEGWGQEQNMLRLNEVFREMKCNGLEPDVVTYGIVINAYCKARKNDEAIELFREMEKNNVKPNAHTFCTLINGLGNEKRLKEALEFFELSKASGFALEAPTYNAVVGAFCWSLQMYDVYRVVNEMRECGIGPNSRTYDIILHHLVKARRTEEAYDIFQKMSSEPLCKPVLSTYEIIVRMFCNERRLDMAMVIWDQMKAKGVVPVMHMYSTLINSLCHENKLDDAVNYLQEMMDMGIRPPVHMFSNLKAALLEDGRKDTLIVLSQKLDNLRKSQLIG